MLMRLSFNLVIEVLLSDRLFTQEGRQAFLIVSIS